MNKDKSLGTKVHYVTHVRHWINWNLEFLEDPFEFPICPYKLMHWIQLKVNDRGSIKSLDQWTAAINWICQIRGVSPSYKLNPEYVRYKKGLNKLYKEGKDHRLPFQLKHISFYIKKLWNLKDDPHTITYANLVRAALAATYYCTMSRPGELAKSTNLDGELRGVTFADYQIITDHQHGISMIHLTINLYKNQASKKIKKQIFFASTRCSQYHNCKCKWVNPYELIILMIRKRKQIVRDLKDELRTTFNHDKRQKILKKLESLDIKPSTYLFVHESGQPVATGFITKLSEEIKKRNCILDSHHYSAYSLRIGGTTRALLAGIEQPMILRYVGWSASRLVDCSMRYMRFGPHHFAMVPFKMIHPKQAITDSGRVYDPWSEQLDQKYYNKQ